MYIALSLFVLLLSLTSCKQIAKLHASIATDIQCSETSQCIAMYNYSWCESDLTCIEGYCHHIRDTPCHSQRQTCDEENRVCIDKLCQSNAECDDGVYCNGKEKCLNGTCMPDKKGSPCRGGICNETAHTCIRPDRLARWRNFKSASDNTTSPPAIISPSEDRLWVGYIFGGIIMLIFFAFVFLMIALVNRNYTPIPVEGASWMY